MSFAPGRDRCPRCAVGPIPIEDRPTCCTDYNPCAWLKEPVKWTDIDELVMVVDLLMAATAEMERVAASTTCWRYAPFHHGFAQPWLPGRVMVPAIGIIGECSMRINNVTRAYEEQGGIERDPKTVGKHVVTACQPYQKTRRPWLSRIIHRLHAIASKMEARAAGWF